MNIIKNFITITVKISLYCDFRDPYQRSRSYHEACGVGGKTGMERRISPSRVRSTEVPRYSVRYLCYLYRVRSVTPPRVDTVSQTLGYCVDFLLVTTYTQIDNLIFHFFLYKLSNKNFVFFFFSPLRVFICFPRPIFLYKGYRQPEDIK